MGHQLGHQLRLCFCVCKCRMGKSPSKMLLVIVVFFAVMVKCSNIKLHFHHKIFSPSNMGSMNSISLSIMTRIHLCAGQGGFGINSGNAKKDPQPKGRSTCLPRASLGQLSARVLLFHLKRACGHLLYPPTSRLFSFGIWSHPPNPLSFGTYQPRTWFHPGPSPTPP